MSILFPCNINGGNLPDYPLFPVSESYDNPIINSEMDSGPSKTRLRFTAISSYIKCSMILNYSQISTLFNFYKNTTKFGVLDFEWINFDDNSIVNYRFKNPPIKELINDIQYKVTFELERLP